MRGHFEALGFGHLQLDEAVDEVVVEHAAGLEEPAILVEILQRLAENAAAGSDNGEFPWVKTPTAQIKQVCDGLVTTRL
jgi:hypothetical protein